MHISTYAYMGTLDTRWKTLIIKGNVKSEMLTDRSAILFTPPRQTFICQHHEKKTLATDHKRRCSAVTIFRGTQRNWNRHL